MRDQLLITKGQFDSQNVTFWESVRGRYVTFCRQCRSWDDSLTDKGPQLGIDDKGWVRDVLTCTSTNFLNWTEPQWLQYPTGADLSQPDSALLPAPHIFVGFPGRFVVGR